MLKLLGAALLLSGSAGLGLAAVRRLSQRVAALRSLTQALAWMERELDFRLPATKELLSDAAGRSEPPASGFLRACAEGLDGLDGRPLSGLWRKAAQDELSVLKPRDLEALLSVGAVLGRYDGGSQRTAIAAARERLEACLSDAGEERRRQGRVYGALSVAAGAFLAIILL